MRREVVRLNVERVQHLGTTLAQWRAWTLEAAAVPRPCGQVRWAASGRHCMLLAVEASGRCRLIRVTVSTAAGHGPLYSVTTTAASGSGFVGPPATREWTTRRNQTQSMAALILDLLYLNSYLFAIGSMSTSNRLNASQCQVQLSFPSP